MCRTVATARPSPPPAPAAPPRRKQRSFWKSTDNKPTTEPRRKQTFAFPPCLCASVVGSFSFLRILPFVLQNKFPLSICLTLFIPDPRIKFVLTFPFVELLHSFCC